MFCINILRVSTFAGRVPHARIRPVTLCTVFVVKKQLGSCKVMKVNVDLSNLYLDNENNNSFR